MAKKKTTTRGGTSKALKLTQVQELVDQVVGNGSVAMSDVRSAVKIEFFDQEERALSLLRDLTRQAFQVESGENVNSPFQIHREGQTICLSRAGLATTAEEEQLPTAQQIQGFLEAVLSSGCRTISSLEVLVKTQYENQDPDLAVDHLFDFIQMAEDEPPPGDDPPPFKTRRVSGEVYLCLRV